jgi:hypothetical protein
MQTKPIFISASLIISALCPFVCRGQSDSVYYGTNAASISVSFADTNLSVSARTAIIADLQVCLQEWGKKSRLIIGADEPDLAGYFYNFKKNPHYPGNIKFPGNVVSNTTTGLALQIPKPLSDAYTNAFAFAAANSNTVAAAYAFVAFVSSGDFATLHPEALPDYFMEKNTTPSEIVANAQEIISDLRCQTYYPPSILGFQYSGAGPSATNLWLYVPCSSPAGDGDVEWSPFPAIWHDGKWKFCVWQD